MSTSEYFPIGDDYDTGYDNYIKNVLKPGHESWEPNFKAEVFFKIELSFQFVDKCLPINNDLYADKVRFNLN